METRLQRNAWRPIIRSWLSQMSSKEIQLTLTTLWQCRTAMYRQGIKAQPPSTSCPSLAAKSTTRMLWTVLTARSNWRGKIFKTTWLMVRFQKSSFLPTRRSFRSLSRNRVSPQVTFSVAIRHLTVRTSRAGRQCLSQTNRLIRSWVAPEATMIDRWGQVKICTSRRPCSTAQSAKTSHRYPSYRTSS